MFSVGESQGGCNLADASVLGENHLPGVGHLDLADEFRGRFPGDGFDFPGKCGA